MDKIRVLLADDFEVVRRGVRAILEQQPDIEIVGEVCDGRKAVEKTSELAPDVVVIDISMPELNGIDATRKIRNSSPATEVVVLTRHDSEAMTRDVLKAGARGYVLKSDIGSDLVRAIRMVAKHAPCLTSTASEVVLAGYLANEDDDESPAEATPREREVIQQLAEGKSNKEVAAILGISVHTVEAHRAHIMSKLGFQSFSDLVRYALRNGLTHGS